MLAMKNPVPDDGVLSKCMGGITADVDVSQVLFGANFGQYMIVGTDSNIDDVRECIGLLDLSVQAG